MNQPERLQARGALLSQPPACPDCAQRLKCKPGKDDGCRYPHACICRGWVCDACRRLIRGGEGRDCRGSRQRELQL